MAYDPGAIDATLAAIAQPHLTLPALLRDVLGADVPTGSTMGGRAGGGSAF